jgi:hypothetical protein
VNRIACGRWCRCERELAPAARTIVTLRLITRSHHLTQISRPTFKDIVEKQIKHTNVTENLLYVKNMKRAIFT